MTLHLEVTRYRGLPPERPTRLSLGSGTCTLGRNPDNDLVLGDPERLVSGRHARIEIRDQGVWIIDRSTNGTFLNQSPERLSASQPVELHDGDTLSVGPYEIAVSIDAVEHDADPFALAEGALPGMGGPAPDIMGLLGGRSGEPAGLDRGPVADPFADARPLDPFLAGPAHQDVGPRAAEPHPTPVEHVYFRPPEAQPVPEGYDLLSDALLTPPTPAGTPGPQAPQPSGAELAQTPPGEIALPSDWAPALDLGLQGASGGPVPAPAEQSSAANGEAPRPWAEAPEPPPPPMARPDQPAETPAPPEAPGAPQSRPPADRRTRDLLAAFLTGLGAGDPAQVEDPVVLLRDAGGLLRALTAGLCATMMARARFKSELRLGVTTIRRSENNPFKFSVSPEEALERLLLRPNPAFLPPLDAAQEAFEDIQAHEMAIIAGLRAALRALLARFEPAALETRLNTASGLDRLLPMARKSRYWDLFIETYGDVAADAEEDFMRLFGEAFSRAYEDQILRLAQTRGRRPS